MSLVESIRHDGAIHELRLARPPVNALNPALCDALREAVATAVAEGAHGLVLSGGPKVFSAGMDVPYLLGLGDDRNALKSAWEAFFAAARALAGCPMPVVAAVAGHAPAATTGTAHSASARAAAKNASHADFSALRSSPRPSR